MLILRRKIGEVVVVDKAVRIVLLAVEGERVKLGIDAPVHVEVVREELLKQVNAALVEVEARLEGK